MADNTNTTQLDLNNKEWQQALQVIQYTNHSIFLTGKAGTGKSTFLKYVAQTIKKKHVILAPTGIAAINVGGVTLHSFFKLPFYPLLPNDSRYSVRNIRKELKYNSEKCKLLREVELIIIDEISMVRADIIDFVDKVLRIYTHRMKEPFGGKQMLFVGDVYQLEPVLKDDDRKLLQPFYTSNYFFGARVFQTYSLVSIELKKVYRQVDPTFITILDRIRTNKVSSHDLLKLNTRVIPEQAQGENAGSNQEAKSEDEQDQSLTITLSTRRDQVDWINAQELDKLPGNPTTFYGIVEGDFPQSSLPTPQELALKVGAHVMFIKNHVNHLWVNGTLGRVIGIDDEEERLYILTDEGAELQVEKEQWENTRYHYNEKENKIEEEIIGTYQQFPVKLAWAITIHKSQGLTFNNVSIDFTGGVFAGGQTYVALSRCTSLEGIRLVQPIKPREIFVKNEVVQFAKHFNDNNLINVALQQSQADKEYAQAIEAFNQCRFDSFIQHFFVAIHLRYDIEKPEVKRFIRMKLNHFNTLKAENIQLRQQLRQTTDYLNRLATEYVIMGKECEHEQMTDAAIRNYEKALELCPHHTEATNRLNELNKHNK